jgi:hypothetical protein
VEKIELVQKLTSDLTLALAYDITLSFQGNSRKALSYIFFAI